MKFMLTYQQLITIEPADIYYISVRRQFPYHVAAENACIGRTHLIKSVKTAVGDTLKRLDFAAHSELRENVATINTNEEQKNLFVQYGE